MAWFKIVGYSPTEAQQVFHYDRSRIKLVCGGEQGGKSYSSAEELASQLLVPATATSNKSRVYWITADSYEMTKPEYFYVLEGLQTYEIKKNIRLIDSSSWSDRDKSHIRIGNGAIEIVTKSLRDAIKVAAQSPDGVLICEADQIAWPTIERILMRVTRSNGWVVMSGTFESSLGWMAVKWNEWMTSNNLGAKSFSLPTWSNLAKFPGGRTDPKLKQWETELPEDKFLERFGGQPSPPSGLVIKEFKTDVHVKDIPVDPESPIYLWIDPGFAGAYAVEAIQIINGQVRVVDEIYERLITQDVLHLLKLKPWWHQVKGGTIDVAARQHQAMPAVTEMWAKQESEGGAGMYLSCEKVELDTSIDRLRGFFKINPLSQQPNVIIAPHCRGLISELGGCRSPFHDGGPWCYRKSRDGTILGYEDKNNHALSAMRYGIVHHFGYTRTAERKKTAPCYADNWASKYLVGAR